MDTARGSLCSLCLGTALDGLGNHATTCKRGHLEVGVESGSGLTPDLSHMRLTDVLVLNWKRGKHAALDITVTSLLTPSILTAVSLSEGAAAEEAEDRKHRVNDPKCSELGWSGFYVKNLFHC